MALGMRHCVVIDYTIRKGKRRGKHVGPFKRCEDRSEFTGKRAKARKSPGKRCHYKSGPKKGQFKPCGR